MSETIKSWVNKCIDDGETSREAICRSCQDRFPHKICGWGYITRIMQARRAANAHADSSGDRK